MPSTEPTVQRTPIRFATYDGDVRAELLADPVMGPNLLREAMTVVTADYDSQTDRTRAGFAFTTMPDMQAHPPRSVSLAIAQTDHPAFFAASGAR
ncbi:MAG TPA: hypothetical protein VMV41_16080 [Cellulomonadaceae bacterium]|nr:hypothetical protein [Cellulomonadaceae bacterium]